MGMHGAKEMKAHRSGRIVAIQSNRLMGHAPRKVHDVSRLQHKIGNNVAQIFVIEWGHRQRSRRGVCVRAGVPAPMIQTKKK